MLVNGRNLEIKSRRDFWIPKSKRNIERDKEVNSALETSGWKVICFWGKEIKQEVKSCADISV